MSHGAQPVFRAPQPPPGAPYGLAPDYFPRQVPRKFPMWWLILAGWVAIMVLIAVVLNVVIIMR